MAAKLLHNVDANLSSAAIIQARDQQNKDKTQKVSLRSFSSLLQKEEPITGASENQQQEILKDYLERISQTGARLQKAPTRSVLREYRRLIQGFLQQSLKGLYQVQDDLGRLNYSTGQRKKYALIQVIDEKLEQLVKLVLTEQRANLIVLQRIEEINGLLVNLLS